MPPPATPSAEAPPPEVAAVGRSALWRTLGRHQVGATAATLVDFGAMIGCVELLHISPTIATGVGAALGGFTNFLLGRAWVFRQHSGRVHDQAIRYALVSGGGALLNTLGEHLVHDRAHIQYIVARAMVSIAVSLFWNFPMQREFVFREGRAT
ncbi:MAG TPA: GtrA family protein [Polyangiaceae bacterium]|jgi:putative flippase GtrA|nr:GtrA family protein [Polyangiaceae bacterium]